MINLFVALGTCLTLISISILVFYVIPKQVKEVMRPVNEYTPLRWVLLSISLAFILFSILPTVYTLGRLDEPTQFTLQNLASLSSSLRTIAFILLYISLYAISDVIGRKNNNRMDLKDGIYRDNRQK